jgi:hypothetical protein
MWFLARPWIRRLLWMAPLILMALLAACQGGGGGSSGGGYKY